jgi:hypothetical protein
MIAMTGPRFMRRLVPLTVCGLALWIAAPVQAQTWTSPDPTLRPWLNAHVKVGPFYFVPVFELRDMGLDDNVFNDSTNPKHDLTATADLRSLLGFHFGDANKEVVFGLTQDTDYVWFDRYSSERSLDASLSALFELRTPLFRPWVKWDHLNTHARAGDEIDARVGRHVPDIEVGSDVRFGARLGASAAVRRQDVSYQPDQEFDGVPLETLDITTDDVRVLARYFMTDLSNLAGGVELTHDQSQVQLRNAHDRYYFAGVETHDGALLVGQAFAGYKTRTPLDPTVAPYNGFAGNADMSLVAGEASKIEVSASRDVQFSYDENYSYYVEDGGGAALTRRLMPLLDLQLMARASWLHYTPLLVGTALPRTDRVTVLGAGLGYFLGGGSGSRYGVNIELDQRQSPIADKNYRGLRVFSSVKLTF